jgi:hypothetical protein
MQREAKPSLMVETSLAMLGTVAALYRLATRTVEGKEVRPEVVASTATVRRAGAQIEALFDR